MDQGKLCGKWRRVRPSGRKASSRSGPSSPRLHPDGAGHRVEFQHPVESVEIDRHHPVRLRWRVDAPDHGGAAAVGHHHMALRVRPSQGLFELLLVGRMGHRVRWIVEAAPQRRQQFQRMAAVGVQQPVLGIRVHPALQRRGHLEARRPNVNVGQVRHRRRARPPPPVRRAMRFAASWRSALLGSIRDEAPGPEAAFSHVFSHVAP